MYRAVGWANVAILCLGATALAESWTSEKTTGPKLFKLQQILGKSSRLGSPQWTSPARQDNVESHFGLSQTTRAAVQEDDSGPFYTSGVTTLTASPAENIALNLRGLEMQYLKESLVLLKEAAALEEDLTKRTVFNDKIRMLDDILSKFGHFDLPLESIKYMGGAIMHLLQRQGEQEIKHLVENYMLIKYAITKERDSFRRDMLNEKLRRLEQVLNKFGSETEFMHLPVGFDKKWWPHKEWFHNEWLHRDVTDVMPTIEEGSFINTPTQHIVQKLRELEVQYLKENLVVLKEAAALEEDLTKRTVFNDKIRMLDDILSKFGRFDLPLESIKYMGGAIMHLLQRQGEQEIKHLVENYMLIKYAITKEQDSFRRDMLNEKLRQLELVFSELRAEPASFVTSPAWRNTFFPKKCKSLFSCFPLVVSLCFRGVLIECLL